jgi:tRNA (guanosine-2'-O-)-methyltransferase
MSDTPENADATPAADEVLTAGRLARLQQVADQRLGCLDAVFDGLHNPRNISACLRSAEAFGLQHVHLIDAAGFTPNRAITRAADRWLTVRRHRDVDAGFAALRADGYTIWGTALEAGAVSVFDLPLPPRLAVVVGSENAGLSDAARAGCDRLVVIPMAGFSQSLNVSTAVTVLLHYLSLAYRRERGDDALLPPAERQALFHRWCQRDLDRKLRRRRSQTARSDRSP